jgi:hypothetical protein
MSASGVLSDVSAKVLNSTEGAHIENMSTFEADEHLQALTPAVLHSLREADRSVGHSRQKGTMLVWEGRLPTFC